MEFFLFASAAKRNGLNRAQRVNNDLATISGFAPMPLITSLGYHFCKWANVSAEILMERNRNFTDHGFPIDVLWSDIEWAMKDSVEGNYEYFVFNE
jgi:alpha-glucosidase (family GH31 glycosyl hydrolase)